MQALLRKVLGESAWNQLAPVVRRHYDLAPGQASRLEGVMEEIWHAAWAKPILALCARLETLVPYRGGGIPAEVRHRVDPEQPDTLHWHRTFRFPGGRTALFRSRMEADGPGGVVERVALGFGVRMAVAVANGALRFTSRGHCWRIGRWTLNLPDGLLLGRAVVVESAMGTDRLRVDFRMTHPWFGGSLGYRGWFRITESAGAAHGPDSTRRHPG